MSDHYAAHLKAVPFLSLDYDPPTTPTRIRFCELRAAKALHDATIQVSLIAAVSMSPERPSP
jgi:hypothetical protein